MSTAALSDCRALSAAEARSLTDEVKADATALWAKMVALYEGGAHAALGYASWGAYCAAEFDMRQSHAYRILDAGRVVARLELYSPNGEYQDPADPPANEAQARELVPLLDDETELVETWRELRAEHGQRLTAEKVRRAVNERLRLDRQIGTVTSSLSAEYYTPAEYVEAARVVLGGIDLDPASCAQANATVGASSYFDAATDGLGQEWGGRVYMNPPYGRNCPRFVSKLLAAYDAGEVEAAILLLSSYSTDVGWFQPLWSHLLCFVKGRIAFNSPADDEGRPTTGSVFAYVGPDWERFASVFGHFGAVVARLGSQPLGATELPGIPARDAA